MQNTDTHTILDKVISLTSERDLASLEYLLAKSIADLMLPNDADVTHAVKIYRASNLAEQVFTSTDTERNADDDQLSQALKDLLSQCFTSSECKVLAETNKPSITLFPLKDASSKTLAVIAIQAQTDDVDLNNTITQLLHIYENFSGLIRDNEHDTLTGLLNRKTFEHKINKVLSITHKEKMRQNDQLTSVYFLAIFDIDHFKKVNDVYGHLIGDEVLLTFSQIMSKSFREKDMLFRYGGEEFVGVFECANKIDIEPVLERFRLNVANHTFPTVNDISVSIGFTQILPFDATLQIINRSDQALYYAKKNGRNQTRDYEVLIDQGKLKAVTLEQKGDVELF